MTLHEYLKSREGKEWTNSDTLEALYKLGAIDHEWAQRCEREAQARVVAAVRLTVPEVQEAVEAHRVFVEYLWGRIQNRVLPSNAELEVHVGDLYDSWQKLQNLLKQKE